MISKRIRKGTKKTYGYGEKRILSWLRREHEECFNDDDELILPLEEGAIVALFGCNLLKKNGKFKSVSTVGGIRSALKNMYHDQELNFDLHHPRAAMRISDIIKGHARHIVDLKEEGAMDVSEGVYLYLMLTWAYMAYILLLFL
jgi:hypothetical protein